MYKPSEGNEMGISYGKRITRPNYSWLNPSKSYYNKYSYFIGDVNLQPTITHNFSFLYTLKSKYNFDLYYRNEKNPSMEISFQDNATNMVVYHFTNIAKDQAVGLDFSCNLELKPWWTIALQSGMKYTEDLFQGIDGNLYQNDVWGFNGSINQQFNLNKKKDFTAEVNFRYDSPSVQGTFTITGSSSLEISFRKKFWDNKAEVSLILSDIYRGEKSIVSTKYADQNNYFYDYSDTQSFRISFKYNLGNQILKNKAEKEKTEEQKRL
jgi:outer membrane receptor protein involved in Fe transport